VEVEIDWPKSGNKATVQLGINSFQKFRPNSLPLEVLHRKGNFLPSNTLAMMLVTFVMIALSTLA